MTATDHAPRRPGPEPQPKPAPAASAGASGRTHRSARAHLAAHRARRGRRRHIRGRRHAGRVRRSRPYRRVSGDPQAAQWPPPQTRGGHRFLAFVVRHAFMVDTPQAREKGILRTPDSYGLNAHEAHAHD